MLQGNAAANSIVGVECDYKLPTTFGDEVEIKVEIEEFRGVMLVIKYTMTKCGGELVLSGRTKHCFLNSEGKPIMLRKQFPEFDSKLKELAVCAQEGK